MVTHRLGNSLAPSSCDGDPAPNLELPAGVVKLLALTPLPNGDRIALLGPGSIGDVFVVDDPDIGWPADIWGTELRFKR